MAKKKKKVRVDMRKNRNKPARDKNWTRGFQEHGFDEIATRNKEQVRAKGDLSRKRTIIQEEGDEEAATEMPAVDSECVEGRVIRVHGLNSIVEIEDGTEYRCTVRRVLKTLSTDDRNIVATGDNVWIRIATEEEGVIERVEPRKGLLTRASRNRVQVIAANVEQVVIVVALVEPTLKPHLIDRYLASAEQGELKPIICLNKADLVDPAAFQPYIGLYSQLGIPTLLTSPITGFGIDRLRELLKDRQTVFSGQSGVGKSSLLNAVVPDLELRVSHVSDHTQKGRHTTTFAEMLRLPFGGWVVDTPGIRQFALWDIIPEEVEGFFPEFRPFVALCGFPDCTHTHEDRCALKEAVTRGQVSEQRYTSYLGMFRGEDVE